MSGDRIEACPHCKQEIDPEVCWCGEKQDAHQSYDNYHPFIPMGCNCYRDKDEAEAPFRGSTQP